MAAKGFVWSFSNVPLARMGVKVLQIPMFVGATSAARMCFLSEGNPDGCILIKLNAPPKIRTVKA
eukprot:2474294-Amphidinium_carterae.1